jgi:hypothetical protein
VFTTSTGRPIRRVDPGGVFNPGFSVTFSYSS